MIRRLVLKPFFLAEQKKQKQLEYSSLGLHCAVILNVFGRLCISLPGLSYLTSNRGMQKSSYLYTSQLTVWPASVWQWSKLPSYYKTIANRKRNTTLVSVRQFSGDYWQSTSTTFTNIVSGDYFCVGRAMSYFFAVDYLEFNWETFSLRTKNRQTVDLRPTCKISLDPKWSGDNRLSRETACW